VTGVAAAFAFDVFNYKQTTHYEHIRDYNNWNKECWSHVIQFCTKV